MFTRFARGMVYWCDIPKYEQNPNVQAGMRPVIIVSNNIGNIFSKNVTIVPCTTNTEKNPEQPTHIQINLDNKQDSLVLCEMIITVSKDLLKTFMGMLDEVTMKEVDKGIESALGLIDIPFPVKKVEEDMVKERQKPNKGRRIRTSSDMHAFIQYAATHTNQETMSEYGIPTSSAVSQRINYYKRKLKIRN